MVTIQVARDFSRYPGGRYRNDGNHSGEEFRQSVLVPKLRSLPSHEKLVVELDGVMGYPASFLEEAFGGLIRSEGFTKAEIAAHLMIKAISPRFESYRQLILRYLSEAQPSPQAYRA